MAGPLMPFVRGQWFDDNGDPLAAGQLYVYLSGTSTKTDTWNHSDLDPAHLNANPVILDAAGRATVYLDPEITYKFIMAPSTNSTDPPSEILWTNDVVPGLVNPFAPPVTLQIDAIGSTSTDDLILLNATSAANGAQQWSPRARLTGSGWNPTASASRVVDAIFEARPLQQASGDPIVALTFSTQVNAGGYTPRFAIQSDGAAVLGSAGQLAWSSSGLTSIDTGIRRTAARKLAFDDGAGTASAGVVFDFSTANTVKLRNLADSDFANTFVRSLVAESAGAAPISCTNAALADNVFGGALLFGRSQATNDSALWAFRPQATPANSTVELYWFGGTLAATFDKGGTLALQGGLQFNDTTESIVWSSQSKITGVANGLINLTQNTGNVGIGLRFSTDAILEVRNRANDGYADIIALNITGAGYSVTGEGNGVATFGPAAVASITVKQGIIIAIS